MEYGRLVLSRNDGEGILIDGDMYRFFCARKIFFTDWQNQRHSMPMGVDVEQKTSAGNTIYITLTLKKDSRAQIRVAITAPRSIVIMREELVEESVECLEQ